jgi:HAD superfamily phosphoserine phosphatase-like hydrolase
MNLFIFDFDKTITSKDTTDLILELPNEDQIWQIEDKWKKRKITSYQCMKTQARFLKGITKEEIHQHLTQHSSIDRTFSQLVQFLKTQKICTVILSEGYDVSIKFHGVQNQINEIYCSHLVTENGLLTGKLEVSNEKTWNYNETCIGCCICKVDFLRQLSTQYEITQSFAVGDGRSDACLFKYVDVSFSLNPKYDATYQVKDLSDVLRLLKKHFSC